MFDKYINNSKNELISSICDLISYPSVSIESDSINYPFGKECADCLRYFLDLAKKLGFKTKNLSNYCGYVEFGSGKELVGIVGHLDVVPANEQDWSFSPFVPTVFNNCIYGRGAIDDKGPVTSCLYAMKAVKDYLIDNNITPNKRVRLIVGLNEEKNWKCIEYYKAHEEIPLIGFSPDSDFPCIYAEKGILSISISNKLDFNSNIIIESVDCDNNPINVVPKYASVILSINKKIPIDSVISKLKKFILKYNYEIDIYKIDDEHIKLTSYGKASHSAHPELGKNAITKLLIILNELFNNYKIPCSIISDFCKYIGDDFKGTKLGIDYSDESGYLTLNTSQIYIEDNKLYICMNLRVPVHTNIDDIVDKYKNTFLEHSVNVIRIQNPLLVDKQSPLVTTLTNVFNETCLTSLAPIAIGGATFARAFDNFVCFGMNFPGCEDMCHKSDEYIRIDSLMLATKIYANAIYKLMQ